MIFKNYVFESEVNAMGRGTLNTVPWQTLMISPGNKAS